MSGERDAGPAFRDPNDADHAGANVAASTTAITSSLTRKYDRQLREAESAMKKWKNEMKKMKEEVETRPTRQDLDDGKGGLFPQSRHF